jgi:urease accessory protein
MPIFHPLRANRRRFDPEVSLADDSTEAQCLVVPGTEFVDHLLHWQLADSAFPIGGFAHSGGLEAARQHGEVRNRGELRSFIESSLCQTARLNLPFVTGAHGQPGRLNELDRMCEACTSNHVANRASRIQGRALLATAERAFASSLLKSVRHGLEPPPCGHFAPLLGVVASALGVDAEAASHLYLFMQLRGLISSSVRLDIVGPLEAASLQHELRARAAEILVKCRHLTLDQIAQTSPLLEIWQSSQDRLYSRLFQS